MVLPVSDVDVTVVVDSDAPSLIEFARTATRLATLAEELAIGAEHLKPVVATVNNDQVAIFLDRQARRTQQFAVTAAGRPQLGDELAAGIEHGNRVGPLVRAIYAITLVIHGDAKRPDRLAVPLAI